MLVAGVCAHAAVNGLNEYQDFKSGLDFTTQKTPFSGGSGSLIENPAANTAVLIVSVLCLIITLITGAYVALNAHPLLFLFGGLGSLIIVTYTGFINRHPILCLIAPGLVFGPLMVTGVYLGMTGSFEGHPLLMSLVPFFLVNNLLLVNQIPDISADKNVGRRTFPIVFGLKRTQQIYAVFSLLAGVCILVLSSALAQKVILIALLPWLLTWVCWYGIKQHSNDITRLTPFMGLNVACTLLTPALLCLTVVL